MDEQESVDEKLLEQKIAERREFMEKAGKVAVTVPAVALLPSATGRPMPHGWGSPVGDG